LRRGRLLRLERQAPLAEELRNAVQRVVGLAGIRAASGRLPRMVALGVQIDFPGVIPRAQVDDEGLRHFTEEPTWCGMLLLPAPKASAIFRPGQDQTLARARHPHVAQRSEE